MLGHHIAWLTPLLVRSPSLETLNSRSNENLPGNRTVDPQRIEHRGPRTIEDMNLKT